MASPPWSKMARGTAWPPTECQLLGGDHRQWKRDFKQGSLVLRACRVVPSVGGGRRGAHQTPEGGAVCVDAAEVDVPAQRQVRTNHIFRLFWRLKLFSGFLAAEWNGPNRQD